MAAAEAPTPSRMAMVTGMVTARSQAALELAVEPRAAAERQREGRMDRRVARLPTAPISCSPDISGQMVPCEGTPAEVPTQTKSFSVTGPFSAGETVALSLRASSRSGMGVQAFAEQTACDDSMTMITEVVVPNADYSCAEVTVTEAAQAVRFEFLDEAVSYPWLYAVCGGCP